MCGLLVQKSESLADEGVTRASEPTGLAGRQRVNVAPQGLDEEHLRELGENQAAAGIGSAHFVHGEADGMFEPLSRSLFGDMHDQHSGQASQKTLLSRGSHARNPQTNRVSSPPPPKRTGLSPSFRCFPNARSASTGFSGEPLPNQ